MAKKPTITTIASGYYSRQALNNNFTALKDAFDNTVSRDGSTPNTMTADFDLNNNDILNAGVVNAVDVVVAGNSVAASVAAAAASAAAAATASALGYVAVDTITELKASATEVGTVHLFAAGRSGAFKWRSGDFSTEITTDTQSGVYVKSDDVASNLGAWVRVFDGPLQSGWFGVSPLGVLSDTISDLAVPLNAMCVFAKAYFNQVEFQPGLYYFSKWTLLRGVEYVGLGSVQNVRSGYTSGTEYDSLAQTDDMAIFVAMGTDANTFTLDGVSDGVQLGYRREFSTATFGVEGYDDIHPSSAAPFTGARLFDGTDKDAVTTTRATLRTLRAAVVIEDSFEKITLRGIRIISSNPGSGETYGVAGYADETTVAVIPNYDFGLFYRNAWGVDFDRLQVVGYWRDVGTFCYLPPADGFTSVTANSEQGLIQRCVFQSGLAFRCGDLFPVVDKTASAIYIRWSASHRFAATGTVNITVGDTFGNSAEHTYTALAYSTAATPNEGKTGEFLVLSIADTSAINVLDKIETVTGQGGISHTRIVDSRIVGFDHHTGLDQASDELAAYCTRYTPSLEVSGTPMRAIKFENCVFNTTSPVIVHIGAARDIEFSSCYGEAKAWKWTLGGALQSARGGILIAGPSSSTVTRPLEAGAAGSARVYFEKGRPWNSSVSLAPFVEPRAGTRLSTMTDVFNPARLRLDAWSEVSSDTNKALDLLADQEYSMKTTAADFSTEQMFRLYQASGSSLLDLGNDGSGGYQLRLRSTGQIDFSGPVDVNGYEALNVNGAHNFKVYTTTEIADATHVSNTQGKQEGTSYFGSDTNKLYIALGAGATSVWADMEGTSNITPS
jgi:hypothetical protein